MTRVRARRDPPPSTPPARLRPRAVARWGVLGGCVLLLVGTACTRKEPDRPRTPAATPEPVIDTAGDGEAAARGWALAVAKDPAPIAELAKFDGWRSYFGGHAGEALDKLLEGGMPTDPIARIGVARAALDLSHAHQDLQRLVLALTPDAIAALATRPGIEAAAPWIAFIEARHAAATGQPTAAALSRIPADTPAAQWGAMLAPDATTPAAALLRGLPSGVEAELPPGATKAYVERLNVAALVEAGRLEEARKRLARIPATEPDFSIDTGEGAVGLWDPLSLRGATRVYAGVARAAVEGLAGWPQLLAAEAQILLGDPSGAAQVAAGLADAPPAEAPLFAQLVLTDAHDAIDLKHSARALQGFALRAAGKTAEADAAAAKIPTDTIAHRVLRLWAGATDAEDAFPRDRSVLAKVLLDKFAAMGEVAGAGDFSDLALADRYVDAVQRRYGAALYAADRKALAVKAFESAEDKSAGLEPSRRNLVPAMVAAARMNVGIGRPRVSLKYLSRLGERLPAVAAPAEMLRDLLSLRAMENSGGATAGQ